MSNYTTLPLLPGDEISYFVVGGLAYILCFIPTNIKIKVTYKKAQLTQGLARDSAATWRIHLKFDNAQFG